MALMVVYEHDHECSMKGEEVVTYPAPAATGATLLIIPVCEETLSQLHQTSVERYGT